MTMGTSFSYVCLTHTPALVSEVDIHGHGNVTNSDTVAKMRELWEYVTFQRSGYVGRDHASAEAWLRNHRRCLIGVQDGYGGQVELGQALPLTPPADDPTEDWDMEFLGEVKPGKRYMLRATENISPDMARVVKDRLREVFPDSEFGILTPNIEPVVPIPVPGGKSFVDVLRDVADTWPPYSDIGSLLRQLSSELTKTGDGAATPPASPTQTPVATGGEQAAESATGGATPAAAPSPSHSDEVVIRAYALGIANSHGRLTPTDNDWSMARSWWNA
jgi:hypothetical protein